MERSKIDDFLGSSEDNPSVVLYGAGFAMPAALKKLEKYGFSVLAICDSDPKKHGTTFRGVYPIVSFEEARRDFPSARFLISSPNYFWEIYSLLSEVLDKHSLCDVDLECAHYFEKGEFSAFFKAELERFEDIYHRLQDQESKDTFFKVIKAHVSGDRKAFEAASTGNDDWYLFRSLLKPKSNAVYVDCGAYDGDTIKLFLQSADDGYKKIFAFEPDPSMQSRLKDISDSQSGKIEIIPKGVANNDGNISFVANGVYSNIVKDGKGGGENLISISTAKLDSLLLDEEVSMLKMDIEGGEYDALNGAAKLIKKYNPNLAICLYHKVEDFVRIPELILQLVPEYKIYLRHQSEGCTDTILFATLD